MLGALTPIVCVTEAIIDLKYTSSWTLIGKKLVLFELAEFGSKWLRHRLYLCVPPQVVVNHYSKTWSSFYKSIISSLTLAGVRGPKKFQFVINI